MLSSLVSLKLLLDEIFGRLQTALSESTSSSQLIIKEVLSVKQNVSDITSMLEREVLGLLKELDSTQAILKESRFPNSVEKQRPKPSEPQLSAIITLQSDALRALTEGNLRMLGSLDMDNYKGSRSCEIGTSYMDGNVSNRSTTNAIITRILEKSESLSAKLINRK
jgi:hypothetical protein